jgi:hypothetical protein
MEVRERVAFLQSSVIQRAMDTGELSVAEPEPTLRSWDPLNLQARLTGEQGVVSRSGGVVRTSNPRSLFRPGDPTFGSQCG